MRAALQMHSFIYLYIWLCAFSVASNSLRPLGLYPPPSPKLLCLWNFPGKNTGVGCHFFLQGIFSTHGSSPQSPAAPALAGTVFTTEPPGKPSSQWMFAKWMDEWVNRWMRNQRTSTRHHGWFTLCTMNAKNEKLDNQSTGFSTRYQTRNILAFTASEYQDISTRTEGHKTLLLLFSR